MTSETTHPPDRSEALDEPNWRGRVEVRIVSDDAEAARRVADALRLVFAGDEQRSYPVGPGGTGTRLHLTLNAADAVGPLRSWLDTSRPSVDRAHQGETG
jgi:hypothetical protein